MHNSTRSLAWRINDISEAQRRGEQLTEPINRKTAKASNH
jgi:hypothetical protein